MKISPSVTKYFNYCLSHFSESEQKKIVDLVHLIAFEHSAQIGRMISAEEGLIILFDYNFWTAAMSEHAKAGALAVFLVRIIANKHAVFTPQIASQKYGFGEEIEELTNFIDGFTCIPHTALKKRGKDYFYEGRARV